MRAKVAALRDDQISEIEVEGIGQVVIGTTRLPDGALSAWDPRSRILVINRSLSTPERLRALCRWSYGASLHALCCLGITGLDRLPSSLIS